MRELKFRAYIKPLKRYATGLDTIQFHKCCDVAGAGIWSVVTLNEGIFDFDDIIVEQFIGQYDKNGKEVYEGDLFMDDGEYYVIKQPSGYAVLYLCHIDDDYGDDLDHYYFGEMEVVGNVNENKEQ